MYGHYYKNLAIPSKYSYLFYVFLGMSKKYLFYLFIFWSSLTILFAQPKQWNSSDIKIHLEKLNTLGSVLYFAAHPDDENTRLIAWLAQEKKYRTGYLSLTRGEGGQNLIGTDLGVDLGLIRTQELLAARRTDKGEQFFSSAFDFGFSKTHEETFRFWDKQSILAEAVYIIRKFRPDIIITRFPPDKRGGHGHHQASAILAHEAFLAAADPSRFPEQLNTVKPWQATRLIWNTANFGGMNNTSESQLKIDIGAYNPILGQSYGEIAALSRSQHKSQGFGAASTRGRSIEYFEHVAGKEATATLMDDVNTSWNRIAGTEKIQNLVQKINEEFDPNHPEEIVQDLFSLRKEVQTIPDEYWKIQKAKEVEDLIIACAGIWADAVAGQPYYAVHQDAQVQLEAIVRNPGNVVKLVEINGKSVQQPLDFNILWKDSQTMTHPKTTQPYWLELPHTSGKFAISNKENTGKPLNSDNPAVDFVFDINGEKIKIHQAVNYRFVDPVRGEVYQPVVYQPQLTASAEKQIVLSSSAQNESIKLTFQNNDTQKKSYRVEALAPQGWEISPRTIELDFKASSTAQYTFQVKTTKKGAASGPIYFKYESDTIRSVKTLRYDHIPSVTWFPTLAVQCRQLDLVNPVKKVGYINGAGDLIPQSLNNIGIEVTTLSDKQIEANYLQQFDAVVVGVRYFNVQENSNVVMDRLLQYVNNGGVVLVQYNVNSRLQSPKLGPYPFDLSRDRVTEEDAKVIYDTKDPAFNYPNKITEADFESWVQERGLYFADHIDKAYRTPIKMHDKDETASRGSLLIAKYGKGKFVYTSLSFFRQLPAGVPGAYRLFVNLLAKEN